MCTEIRKNGGLYDGGAGGDLALGSAAQAATIYQYNANSQPTAPDPLSVEGGSFVYTATSHSETDHYPGSELGTNYWNIFDDNLPAARSLLYSKTAVASDFSDPDGWWARTTLRVVSGTPTTSGIVLELRDGVNYFNVCFVNNGPGEEYIAYQSTTALGFVKLADAELSDAYFTVDAVYTPSTDDLTVYYNGTQVGSPIPRSSFSGTGIRRFGFGSNTAAAVGEHHWADVQFNTGAVPEPSALALLGVYGLMLAKRRRRV